MTLGCTFVAFLSLAGLWITEVKVLSSLAVELCLLCSINIELMFCFPVMCLHMWLPVFLWGRAPCIFCGTDSCHFLPLSYSLLM